MFRKSASLMFIESQQALYEGASYYWPERIWNVAAQKWQPYKGKVPKPQAWGDIVSEAEAEEWKRP